jgi:hypothetical protein
VKMIKPLRAGPWWQRTRELGCVVRPTCRE